jgi:pimeloyl-ACP methyl ester carboxylesterase
MKWLALFYPAYLDPKFALEGYPPDYMTMVPGGHALAFFNPDAADPAVIAMDEELKGTATSGEFGPNGGFVVVQPQFSLRTKVPVLIAVGTDDAGTCSPELPCDSAADIIARESQFWPPEACLEAFVLPRAGHALNLHHDGLGFHGVSNGWVARRVGRDVNHPPMQPCR